MVQLKLLFHIASAFFFKKKERENLYYRIHKLER